MLDANNPQQSGNELEPIFAEMLLAFGDSFEKAENESEVDELLTTRDIAQMFDEFIPGTGDLELLATHLKQLGFKVKFNPIISKFYWMIKPKQHIK